LEIYSTEEEALLDKAFKVLIISNDFLWKLCLWRQTTSFMEDLMNVLDGMDGGEKIALRLSKYVTVPLENF
jgi:hypothetical protein